MLGENALSGSLSLTSHTFNLSCSFLRIGVHEKYLIIMYTAQVTLTVGIGLFIELGFTEDLTKISMFGVGYGTHYRSSGCYNDPRHCGSHLYNGIHSIHRNSYFGGN